MKQKHEFKNIVAETLLIPLYMRAKESRRDNPILYDKAAERLADSLEYDYSQFDGAKGTGKRSFMTLTCRRSSPCAGS